MKKLLFALFITTFGISALNAQCVPDTTITQIIVPPAGSKIDTANSIVILPYGHVNQSYSEVIHFKVPSDTTFGTQQIPINHVQLDGILGLPSTLVVQCTPGSCKFPGGSYGCAEMTGTPTMADSIGLRVAIEYNITVSGLPTPIKDTLEGYYLVIKGNSIGQNEGKVEKSAVRLYPNPAQEQLFLTYNSDQAAKARIQISSIIGTVVFDKTYGSTFGENQVEINTSNFKPGVYMYNLKVGDKSYAGRFSISR